jgi:hypothetical protein
MSKFLEDLKNAADGGEFNSEAAKKIIEVSEAAENKAKNMEPSLKKRMEDTPVEPVSEDEVSELNSEYETEIKEVDAANNQLAMLVEIEDMVKLTLGDMLGHIESLEENLKDKLNDTPYQELNLKIKEIKSKYKF